MIGGDRRWEAGRGWKQPEAVRGVSMETLDPSQLSCPLKFNMVLVPIPSEARHFVKIFTSFQSSPLKIREINKFVTETISSLTEIFKSPLKV